jgi:hypothetical protein
LTVINNLSEYEKSLSKLGTFKCSPIVNQLKVRSKELKSSLDLVISKTVESLGLDLSETQIKLLVEDVIEVYKHESFEDLVLLFRNIRRGEYGKIYGKLNMIYIREAMAQYLENKYSKLESHLHNEKTEETAHAFKTRKEYLEAVEEGMKAQRKVHKMQGVKDLEEYNRFKIQYLKELKDK